MTLDDVRALLCLREKPQKDCSEVNAVLDEHIGHVAQRIRELRALQKDLLLLRGRCSSPHTIDDCGILNGLARAASGAAPAARRHVRGAH
jgi:DNA-binding transcriptional MerR regulator